MSLNFAAFSQDLKIFTLKNGKGTTLKILNFGATVFSLTLKTQNGQGVNVVVGPKDAKTYLTESYFQENRCFGASVGRYAGRISNGKFDLDGKTFSLHEKDGAHLHGGYRGFQFKLWQLIGETKTSIILGCISEDGEEGYPGKLEVQVRYTLTEENEMVVEYWATTNKRTPLNLTNHTYYNLNGSGSVENHQLQIDAVQILELDDKKRPTGKLLALKNKSKDFSELKQIGENEVDDTFILKSGNTWGALLKSAFTGISMEIETNQPAIVVYVPKIIPNIWEYQTGSVSSFPSICLETQNFPDAPNHSNFPCSILNPGEKYHNRSIFRFIAG